LGYSRCASTSSKGEDKMNFEELKNLSVGDRVRDITNNKEGTVSVIVKEQSLEASEIHAETSEGESLSIFPDELEVINTGNIGDIIEAQENARVDFQFLLQKALNQAKISRKVLAERLGVSVSTVNRFFRSDANPDLRKMIRIFNALDCEIDFKFVKNPKRAK
jgi:hypothetical protein